MLALPSFLDCIHIRSNLYSKHLVLVILLVTMIPDSTMTAAVVPSKRTRLEFVSLLHCVVTSVTHSFHVRTGTFLISGRL